MARCVAASHALGPPLIAESYVKTTLNSAYPLIFSLVFMLLLGCERPRVHATAEDDWDASSLPASESWDVLYSVSETDASGGSRRRLEMEAGYMASFESDSSYTLLTPGEETDETHVRAVIFDPATSDTSAVIHAERIIYRENDRFFEASNDVRVRARGDRLLWSERLVWNERSRRVRAPGFVRVVTPSERIEGYNLDADEDLDNYRLERVTGSVEIDELTDEPVQNR